MPILFSLVYSLIFLSKNYPLCSHHTIPIYNSYIILWVIIFLYSTPTCNSYIIHQPTISYIMGLLWVFYMGVLWVYYGWLFLYNGFIFLYYTTTFNPIYKSFNSYIIFLHTIPILWVIIMWVRGEAADGGPLAPAAHKNNNFKMHIIDFLTQLSMDFCRLLT